MQRKSATAAQEFPLTAEAGTAPSWLPMWAAWCCGAPNPAAMWAMQSQQLQAAYQQGLEQGRREAAAMHAAALLAPGKN